MMMNVCLRLYGIVVHKTSHNTRVVVLPLGTRRRKECRRLHSGPYNNNYCPYTLRTSLCARVQKVWRRGGHTVFSIQKYSTRIVYTYAALIRTHTRLLYSNVRTTYEHKGAKRDTIRIMYNTTHYYTVLVHTV